MIFKFLGCKNIHSRAENVQNHVFTKNTRCRAETLKMRFFKKKTSFWKLEFEILYHIVQAKLGGSHWKGLNLHLILDHGRWRFYFGVIVTKMLSKITDVLRFFETFSSLIPVASFASGRRHPALGTPEGTPPRSGWRHPCAHYTPYIRYEKSLQNLKNQWSQSIFVRSPKIKPSSPRSHR